MKEVGQLGHFLDKWILRSCECKSFADGRRQADPPQEIVMLQGFKKGVDYSFEDHATADGAVLDRIIGHALGLSGRRQYQSEALRGDVMATLRNPIEWAADQVAHGAEHAEAVGQALRGEEVHSVPQIRKITLEDLKASLRQGVSDFGAGRTDVIFLCIVYPIAGLVLARFFLHETLLPLLFPVISGFALIGPVAAIGLYEISRRRERGEKVNWLSALGVLRSPAFGAIFVLGLVLVLLFGLWIGAAHLIYNATLGPEPPASFAALVQTALSTGAGWAMILIGCGVGFLFALLVLSISAFSFPALLDREGLGLGDAVKTSLRAVRENPVTMAQWGMIVAGGLVLGSLPLFIGLIFVMPVLGHATWHLYRKAVA